MVKFASSFLIAALVAVPAFAQVNWDDLDTRDLSETELFGRELTDAEVAILAREIDELYTRFPEEETLESRNFFKKLWHGIKKVAGKVASVVIRREEGAEDELLARDYEEDMYERDLDLNLDLSERDFEDDVFERDFEELSERDYPEEYEREFEEADLLEREYYDDLD
ncbi:hypothetical protein BDZ97DRAFT_1759741 [Flammula alnicola]|nr:hypothetical protein BDZ97DRAFT_1759741 [Flammula alnicola]